MTPKPRRHGFFVFAFRRFVEDSALTEAYTKSVAAILEEDRVAISEYKVMSRNPGRPCRQCAQLIRGVVAARRIDNFIVNETRPREAS